MVETLKSKPKTGEKKMEKMKKEELYKVIDNTFVSGYRWSDDRLWFEKVISGLKKVGGFIPYRKIIEIVTDYRLDGNLFFRTREGEILALKYLPPEELALDGCGNGKATIYNAVTFCSHLGEILFFEKGKQPIPEFKFILSGGFRKLVKIDHTCNEYEREIG